MASQEDLSATLDQIIRQYQELGQLLPQQQAAVDAAASGFPRATAAAIQAGKAVGALGGASMAAAQALYSGQKGMTAFNSALDQVSSALTLLAGTIALLGGPAARVAAVLISVIGAGTKYVKAANEQSDKLYDAFQQMSRSGGAAADGLQGLYIDLQNLGLGVQDLDKFVNMVAQNSKDLVLFSNTVFRGRREFAAVVKEMEPFRAALMNAGLSQDEQNEGIMTYIRLQSRLGQTQNMTTQQLADGARRFLIEQEALTKATGLNRQEQERARQDLRNTQLFQAKMMELERRGMGHQAREFENLFMALGGMATDAGKGFAEMVTGNLLGNEAAKLARVTSGAAQEAIYLLSQDAIKAGQAFDMIVRPMDQMRRAVLESAGAVGVYDETYGMAAQQTELTGRLMAGGFEAALAASKNMGEKMGITGNDIVDQERRRQTDTRLAQQRAMQNLQDFVRLGVDPATRAMELFARVIEFVTNLLPGAGSAKREYAAEKRARSQLENLEKSILDQNQKLLDKEAAMLATNDLEKKRIMRLELQSATKDLENVIKERDALKKKLETPGAFGREQNYGEQVEPSANVTPENMPAGLGGPGVMGVGGAGMLGRVGPGQQPQMDLIKELIAGVESRGDYNVMVGGTTQPLTSMTIGEVLQLQKKLIAEGKNSAAGKYQIKESTLRGSAFRAGFGLNDKFNETTQDKIAEYLINQRGYQQYAARPTTEGKERFLANLAQEWAGLPRGPDGKSYYSGVGNNKAGISWEDALAKFGDGGVIFRPTLAQIGERGPEAVIPLKNGTVPVTITSRMPNLDGLGSQLNQNIAQIVAQVADALKDSSTGQMRSLLDEYRRQQQDLMAQAAENNEALLRVLDQGNDINQKILLLTQ